MRLTSVRATAAPRAGAVRGGQGADSASTRRLRVRGAVLKSTCAAQSQFRVSLSSIHVFWF